MFPSPQKNKRTGREELEQFAGVVFVGMKDDLVTVPIVMSGFVGTVSQHFGHPGMVRNLTDDVEVIAERVSHKDVIERHVRFLGRAETTDLGW